MIEYEFSEHAYDMLRRFNKSVKNSAGDEVERD